MALRSSTQVYIDADLNHNGKKVSNIADGAANNDGASVGQMNTAIGNATSGLGNSLHIPVADLAAAKAVLAAGRADKMLMNVEALGLYRFDLESVAASNDDTVIRPTDIATDATAGRWVKMSSTITDHNNLSGKQGGATGEYNHLTNAQFTALHAAETAASIGAIVNTAAAATPNETDLVPLADAGVIKKITMASFKTFLGNVFELKTNKDASGGYAGLTLLKINFRNAANTFTSFFTNTNTAARTYTFPDKDIVVAGIVDFNETNIGGGVTNTKATPIVADSLVMIDSADSNKAKKLTWAALKTMLGLTSLNLAQRKYRVTPTGTVNGSNVVFTIADLVISGTEEIFRNGILQTATVDYTITYAASTTINFVVAPSNVSYNDVIVVNYSI